MRLRSFLAALPLLVLPVGIGAAEPAAALSCVRPEAVLKDATSIIAGRITGYRDHRILVAVDEIWRGDRVAEEIWLDVELEGWWPGIGRNGELPEDWAPKGQWVFAPKDGAVNPCTAWRLDAFYTEHVQPFRPAEPLAPLASTETEAETGPAREGSPVVVAEPDEATAAELWATAGGGIGLGLLVCLTLFWRERRSRPARG